MKLSESDMVPVDKDHIPSVVNLVANLGRKNGLGVGALEERAAEETSRRIRSLINDVIDTQSRVCHFEEAVSAS